VGGITAGSDDRGETQIYRLRELMDKSFLISWIHNTTTLKLL